MAEKLAPQARTAALKELGAAGWAEVEGRDAIAKSYAFRNFIEAFGWMSAVALTAEKMAHHPEWANVYRTVDVTLSTHDAGGLTELDVMLAKRMDALAPVG